jgi:hypothetical protein
VDKLSLKELDEMEFEGDYQNYTILVQEENKAAWNKFSKTTHPMTGESSLPQDEFNKVWKDMQDWVTVEEVDIRARHPLEAIKLVMKIHPNKAYLFKEQP